VIPQTNANLNTDFVENQNATPEKSLEDVEKLENVELVFAVRSKDSAKKENVKQEKWDANLSEIKNVFQNQLLQEKLFVKTTKPDFVLLKDVV